MRPVVRNCTARLVSPHWGSGRGNRSMPLLRSAFIALSHNRLLRRFVERSRIGRRMSSRFVAGMEIEDALRVSEAVNEQGMPVTLDSLGESVTSEVGSAPGRRDLPPTAGLDCRAQAQCQHQREADADGPGALSRSWPRVLRRASPGTPPDGQLCSHRHGRLLADPGHTGHRSRLHARPELRDTIGIVIQAYLYRSQSDIEQLIADGIRVRLCKGAYKEPAEVAFPAKADVDENYVCLSKMLLESSTYHGLATHDEVMIATAKTFAREHRIDAHPLRVSNVVWSAPRPAAQPDSRGLQRPRLCPLRPRVVSLLHAAAGGAAGECDFSGQEFLPFLETMRLYGGNGI